MTSEQGGRKEDGTYLELVLAPIFTIPLYCGVPVASTTLMLLENRKRQGTAVRNAMQQRTGNESTHMAWGARSTFQVKLVPLC